MSYASAAANVVGGELQGWASLLERNAMFDAYKDELGRQQGYQDQAQGVFDTAVRQQGSDTAQKALATGAGEREQAYKDINQVPLSVSPAPFSGGAEGARDNAFAAQRGQARASLGAYGDWALGKTLNDIQNKESLNQVINFAKGTSGVYPYRAYQAQHSWDDMAMIGAAISSLGGGASNFAQYTQQPGGGAKTDSFGQGITPGGANASPFMQAYQSGTDVNPYVGAALSF